MVVALVQMGVCDVTSRFSVSSSLNSLVTFYGSSFHIGYVRVLGLIRCCRVTLEVEAEVEAEAVQEQQTTNIFSWFRRARNVTVSLRLITFFICLSWMMSFGDIHWLGTSLSTKMS